jgi:hypothetical protein
MSAALPGTYPVCSRFLAGSISISLPRIIGLFVFRERKDAIGAVCSIGCCIIVCWMELPMYQMEAGDNGEQRLAANLLP